MSRWQGSQGPPGLGTASSIQGTLHLLTTLLKQEAVPHSNLTNAHLLETSGRDSVCRPPPSLVTENMSREGR